jgi:signal transduction histidine kinase
MGILGVSTASVDARFGRALRLQWRWLTLYGCMLTLGVAADLVSCEYAPLPLFWAQVLPQLHYIAVVFMSTRFGAAIGLAAACVAALLHSMVIIITCVQPVFQTGHFAMFGAIALTAGLVASLKNTESGESHGIATRVADEYGRGVSLSELGRMTPELVHQFLTPIASIEGAGFVLEDSDLSDDKRQELVAIIRKECRRLGLLVELLDFTQSRNSILRDVDIPGLLDEVIGLCRPKAEPALVLRNTSRRDLPRVQCDPHLVTHAVHALVTNAMRAISPNGELELSVDLPPGEIVVRVLARADHLDASVGSASNPKRRVDLAVVRQIVTNNCGSLRVEPGIRGNITFIMVLPRESEGSV